jgi:hypothetical protein
VFDLDAKSAFAPERQDQVDLDPVVRPVEGRVGLGRCEAGKRSGTRWISSRITIRSACSARYISGSAGLAHAPDHGVKYENVPFIFQPPMTLDAEMLIGRPHP